MPGDVSPMRARAQLLHAVIDDINAAFDALADESTTMARDIGEGRRMVEDRRARVLGFVRQKADESAPAICATLEQATTRALDAERRLLALATAVGVEYRDSSDPDVGLVDYEWSFRGRSFDTFDRAVDAAVGVLAAEGAAGK